MQHNGSMLYWETSALRKHPAGQAAWIAPSAVAQPPVVSALNLHRLRGPILPHARGLADAC
jgi:hypothetical protein